MEGLRFTCFGNSTLISYQTTAITRPQTGENDAVATVMDKVPAKFNLTLSKRLSPKMSTFSSSKAWFLLATQAQEKA